MYIVCVTVWVKAENVEEFIAATLDNTRGTRAESGNLRFDVSQAEDDPNRFFFYEMYKSKADFVAHQQQPHYFKWREAVNGWMAQPRQGLKYTTLFAE